MIDDLHRFDPDMLNGLTRGNRTLALAVVASFRSQFPQQLTGLEQAVMQGDPALLSFHAHAAKGMAKQIGSPSLRQALERLEQGAQECAHASALFALFSELQAEFAALESHLLAYAEQWDAGG